MRGHFTFLLVENLRNNNYWANKMASKGASDQIGLSVYVSMTMLGSVNHNSVFMLHKVNNLMA